jgi:hypothetical protein
VPDLVEKSVHPEVVQATYKGREKNRHADLKGRSRVSPGRSSLDASNTILVPLGIAQNTAQGVYLMVPQEHAILYVCEPGKAAESCAGTLGAPGYRDDLRSKSLFRNPAFLALNQVQGMIYVSDGASNVIRRVEAGPQGKVETFTGTGIRGSSDGGPASAQFNNPQGFAMDNRGYL